MNKNSILFKSYNERYFIVYFRFHLQLRSREIDASFESTKSVLRASQVKFEPRSERLMGCSVNLSVYHRKLNRCIKLSKRGQDFSYNFLWYFPGKYYKKLSYLFSITSPALFSYSSSFTRPFMSHLTIGCGLPATNKTLTLF